MHTPARRGSKGGHLEQLHSRATTSLYHSCFIKLLPGLHCRFWGSIARTRLVWTLTPRPRTSYAIHHPLLMVFLATWLGLNEPRIQTRGDQRK